MLWNSHIVFSFSVLTKMSTLRQFEQFNHLKGVSKNIDHCKKQRKNWRRRNFHCLLYTACTTCTACTAYTVVYLLYIYLYILLYAYILLTCTITCSIPVLVVSCLVHIVKYCNRFHLITPPSCCNATKQPNPRRKRKME